MKYGLFYNVLMLSVVFAFTAFMVWLTGSSGWGWSLCLLLLIPIYFKEST